MTDEELIKKLLDDAEFKNDIRGIAADRIEQLVEERDLARRLLGAATQMQKETQAELAKAVEFIQEVRRNGDTRSASMAIAVLAELEKTE